MTPCCAKSIALACAELAAEIKTLRERPEAVQVDEARLAAVLDALAAMVHGPDARAFAHAEALLVENGRSPRPEPVVESPDVRKCEHCGVVLGNWTRVHFAKATDAKPCKGSWVSGAKEGK